MNSHIHFLLFFCISHSPNGKVWVRSFQSSYIYYLSIASSILILAFIFISKFHPFVQTLDFLQLVLRIVANFLEYFKSKKELHRICSINFSNICAAAIWWTRKTEKMPFHVSWCLQNCTFFAGLFCGNQWSFWIFHVILTIQVSNSIYIWKIPALILRAKPVGIKNRVIPKSPFYFAIFD